MNGWGGNGDHPQSHMVLTESALGQTSSGGEPQYALRPSELPFRSPWKVSSWGPRGPPCPVSLPLLGPTHLLKLLGFVLVGPLQEVEQDDVTEDSPLGEERRRSGQALS